MLNDIAYVELIIDCIKLVNLDHFRALTILLGGSL